MSLVTTARSTGSGPEARARQSAATRAVLPLPTGPPTPMRSGPPLARPCEAAPEPWAWGSGSRCKEGHLCEVGGAGVRRAEEVEDGRRAAGEDTVKCACRRMPGHDVDPWRECRQHAVDSERVEAQQAYGCRRRAGDGAVSRG